MRNTEISTDWKDDDLLPLSYGIYDFWGDNNSCVDFWRMYIDQYNHCQNQEVQNNSIIRKFLCATSFSHILFSPQLLAATDLCSYHTLVLSLWCNINVVRLYVIFWILFFFFTQHNAFEISSKLCVSNGLFLFIIE